MAWDAESDRLSQRAGDAMQFADHRLAQQLNPPMAAARRHAGQRAVWLSRLNGQPAPDGHGFKTEEIERLMLLENEYG